MLLDVSITNRPILYGCNPILCMYRHVILYIHMCRIVEMFCGRIFCDFALKQAFHDFALKQAFRGINFAICVLIFHVCVLILTIS